MTNQPSFDQHSASISASSSVSQMCAASMGTSLCSPGSVPSAKNPLSVLTTNPISDIPFSIGGPAHSQALAALMQRIHCEGCE